MSNDHGQQRGEMPLPCKPDSVPSALTEMDGHLSYPTEVRNLPCRMVRLIPGDPGRAGYPSPVMSCAVRGLPCLLSYPWSGGLLLHLFTLTCRSRRFVFCCTFRPTSLNWLSLVFTRHTALWRPDFPRYSVKNTATARGAANQD